VEHAREQYEVSERHACRLLGQWRRTQRYAAIQRIDEEALTEAIVALASEYGRYGYRRITALLQRAGWHVGKDRVQRIWRREGLKVPQKQRPRGRLWLALASQYGRYGYRRITALFLPVRYFYFNLPQQRHDLLRLVFLSSACPALL
jgi:HTH-like domain